MKQPIHLIRRRLGGQIVSNCCLQTLAVCLLFFSLSSVSGQSRPRQLAQPDTSLSTTQRRIALVVGNSDYRHVARLDNPANDAQDMARALREVGFELVDGNAHLNVSGDEMKRLIIKFGQILKQSGGVGLFYYAGHGIQVGGKNYLIPIEAEALREQTVEFDAVDVNRVLGEMDYAGNGFNLVILDACRSNPFTRSWRSSESGLASISAPEGTLIAYATSPGRVASDGTTRNGIYTEQLLKQMHVPGLSLETVFKAVRANVKAISKGQQIPWESSSIVGDFYFTRGTSPKSAEAQEPATSISPSAIEFAYWESIKKQ
jgi:uncharacterized caspase-like protein